MEDAVFYMSFVCRIGPPSEIRAMLTSASSEGIISIAEGNVNAEFLYEKQSPNVRTVAWPSVSARR
ncbi:MAG: hypothetical protein QXQ81_00905 [Candidatus Thorarchaeota archaeon]